jgi:predicted esterase
MNADTLVDEVIRSDAFKGFGPLLFPAPPGEKERRLTLAQIAPLFPRHSHIDTDDTLLALNFLIKLHKHDVHTFYDLYPAREKRRNAAKAKTGLFYFRGILGAPFAIIVPGCGDYVATLHEGLPCAIELLRPGFNAFVLHYRPGKLELICEDLARAISFVFAHAEELGVATEGYALWGSSAGASAAAYLGSYGPRAFGGDDLPRPSALVMQYASHSNHTRREPPTFACAGADDSPELLRAMRKRIETISACGIDTEYHEYADVGNGFGLGRDTAAAGWEQSAMAFWKRHLPPDVRRLLRRRPAIRLLNRKV